MMMMMMMMTTMMMIMMMKMMMIMITTTTTETTMRIIILLLTIIPFKGAVRECFAVSSLRCQLIPTSGPAAIVCRARATCHVPLGTIVLLVGCLSSQQHASVSQGRICTDNFTCCHTEIEAADQTFHLTQSQYTDTGPTSPSADPITPGAWQGSHWSANV